MTTQDYLRYPHLHGDTITFVADDDVWLAPLKRGRAWRVSSLRLPASYPRFSADGQNLSWTVIRAKAPEVVTARIDGSGFRQLTHFGHASTLNRGYLPDGRILAITSVEQGDSRLKHGYAIDPATGRSEALNLGPMDTLAFAPSLGDERPVVLGSLLSREPAWWKRYRGGTAGRFWIDRDGGGDFEWFVPEIDGNLTDPMWVGGRVYFLSDHEGHGNLYSVTPDGSDLRRHTDHENFYVRHASTDGTRIVFESAGRLFLVEDPTSDDAPVELPITLGSARQPGFTATAGASADVVPGSSGDTALVLSEGTVHLIGHGNAPAREVHAVPGTRVRVPRWVDDHRIAYVLDDGQEEALWISTLETSSNEPLIAAAVRDEAESVEDESGLPQPVSATAVVGDPQQVSGHEPTGSKADETVKAEVEPFAVTPGETSADEDVQIGLPGRHRVVELLASPDGSRLLIGTVFGGLLLADTTTGTVEVITETGTSSVESLAWSPDSQWFAWAQPESSLKDRSRILLRARNENSEIIEVTDGRFTDFDVTFTRDGQHLAFLSLRSFDPAYSRQNFDLGFPRPVKPFLVPLERSTRAPFAARGLSSVGASPTHEGTTPVTRVDAEGIGERVVAVPVAEGNYDALSSAKGALLFLAPAYAGSLRDGEADFTAEPTSPDLVSVDLSTGELSVLREGVSAYRLSSDGTAAVIRTKDGAELVSVGIGASTKGTESRAKKFALDAVRYRVDLRSRFRQQFREAWRLQRDFFWDEQMSQIDWQEVYDRYVPLVERLATDSDLIDLLWELHGELGTSHAYVGPRVVSEPGAAGQGHLGADLVFRDGKWIIKHILAGDSSDPRAHTPLRSAGVVAEEGDVLVAVNGRPTGLSPEQTPQALLAGTAGRSVELTLSSDGGTGSVRRAVVRPVADQERLRYQEWVQKNRRLVHEASEGRFGYVHVPDMGPHGWAQLHRDLEKEAALDALVVDVRRNRGGHTSQLVSELIGRHVTSWSLPRGITPDTYPAGAPRGPVVLLTDEFAGSDGDIITQVTRMRGIGPIVGMRTWGGVIGIDTKFDLVDGLSVTQPRYATWFIGGTGLDVENYGVDPDIEVPFPPHEHRAGTDPQLERGVGILREMLNEIPTQKAPVDWKKPDRRAPKLGPRPQG